MSVIGHKWRDVHLLQWMPNQININYSLVCHLFTSFKQTIHAAMKLLKSVTEKEDATRKRK
jgi:hypothetical protein